jgi:hypothetical protein
MTLQPMTVFLAKIPNAKIVPLTLLFARSVLMNPLTLSEPYPIIVSVPKDIMILLSQSWTLFHSSVFYVKMTNVSPATMTYQLVLLVILIRMI